MSSTPKSSTSRVRVGYALPPRKIQTFVTQSLVSHALNQGIDLIPIDLQKPLIDQGPFDCLIHKLGSTSQSHDWNAQLLDLKSRCPRIVIIDPPQAIEPLNNRVTMLEVVKPLAIAVTSAMAEKIGVPKQVTVMKWDSNSNSNDDGYGLKEMGLRLPLVAKPLCSGGGSLNAHDMFLVLNRDGLKEVKPPVVLQQFVNHGGVVFKVYVAGKHVKCVKRKSVPDVPKEKLDKLSDKGILPFSRISNPQKKPEPLEGGGHDIVEEEEDAFFSSGGGDSRVEDAELPAMCFLIDLAMGLQKALGLHLFNFDLIRDADAGDTNQKFLIIDINYFPGYSKVPGFETMITDFFLEVVAAAKTKEE